MRYKDQVRKLKTRMELLKNLEYMFQMRNQVEVQKPKQGVMSMKKMLIIIGAICYCIAPDLFVGPIDDAIVVLASMAYTLNSAGGHRDPEYMKMERDF